MTQQEFSERIGRKATTQEYEYANGMYMSAGNVDKDTFCAEYKTLMESKSVRAIMDDLLQRTQRMRKLQKMQEKTIDLLITEHHETGADALRVHAILLAGEKQYLLRKIALGFEFDNTDYEMAAIIMELSKDNF